ncbi:hypothetical protein P7K49_024553, partial [Saguinus oedipus]
GEGIRQGDASITDTVPLLSDRLHASPDADLVQQRKHSPMAFSRGLDCSSILGLFYGQLFLGVPVEGESSPKAHP